MSRVSLRAELGVFVVASVKSKNCHSASVTDNWVKRQTEREITRHRGGQEKQGWAKLEQLREKPPVKGRDGKAPSVKQLELLRARVYTCTAEERSLLWKLITIKFTSHSVTQVWKILFIGQSGCHVWITTAPPSRCLNVHARMERHRTYPFSHLSFVSP